MIKRGSSIEIEKTNEKNNLEQLNWMLTQKKRKKKNKKKKRKKKQEKKKQEKKKKEKKEKKTRKKKRKKKQEKKKKQRKKTRKKKEKKRKKKEKKNKKVKKDQLYCFVWELIFYLLRTFCPHLVSFCVVSSFTTFRPNFTSGLSEVVVNHLKKARGEIWPKLSERRNNTKTNKMRTKSPQ